MIVETLEVDELCRNGIPDATFVTWALLHSYVTLDEKGHLKFNIDRINLVGSSYPDPEGEERDWKVIHFFQKHGITYLYLPPKNQDWESVQVEDIEW